MTMREGWEQTTLGDLLRLEYGKALPAKNRIPGDVVVFGSNGAVGTHNKSLVEGPGIVVGRKGTAGSVTWSDSDFFPIDTTYWARVDRSRLSIKFAFHLLCNSDLPRLNTQTGVPGLNRDNVYREPVNLPPLREQRRIVDLMDSVDAAISAAQAEVEAAGELRAKVLEHELSDPGKEWPRATLGEVAQRTIGRTPPRKQARYWTEDLTNPFCTIKAMQNRSGMVFSEGVTEDAIADGVAKLAPRGSLLLSFKLSVGRVRFASEDVFFNEAIAWIRPNEALIGKSFLALALEQVDWESLGSRAVKGKTLNSKSLDAVPLALPPLHEQQRIVDSVTMIDSVEATSATALDRLRELRSSMLGVLLSGEHEIPESYDQFLMEAAAGKTG